VNRACRYFDYERSQPWDVPRGLSGRVGHRAGGGERGTAPSLRGLATSNSLAGREGQTCGRDNTLFRDWSPR
jgi:hypothetical protein